MARANRTALREKAVEAAKQAAKGAKAPAQSRAKSGVYLLTIGGWKKGALRKPGTFTTIFRSPSLDKIEVIKAGVAPGTLDELANAMGERQEVVIRNLGIAKSTWARKRQQNAPLEKDDSELVMGLAALIGQVAALVEEQGVPEGFDAAKWFQKWVEQPVPALNGKKPSELLDTKAGQQIVADLLGAIRGGAYL